LTRLRTILRRVRVRDGAQQRFLLKLHGLALDHFRQLPVHILLIKTSLRNHEFRAHALPTLLVLARAVVVAFAERVAAAVFRGVVGEPLRPDLLLIAEEGVGLVGGGFAGDDVGAGAACSGPGPIRSLQNLLLNSEQLGVIKVPLLLHLLQLLHNLKLPLLHLSLLLMVVHRRR